MKKIRIFAILLALFMLTGCREKELVLLSEQTDATQDLSDVQAATDNTPMIYVHVCGHVKQPGVYELPENSRLYEAIDAAGGFDADADTNAWNLARILKDGERIYAEANVAEATGESGMPPGVSGEEQRVDINAADLDLLCTIPGIGETRAEAILAYREAYGVFTSTEELMNVTGIKEGLYTRIEPYVYVR